MEGEREGGRKRGNMIPQGIAHSFDSFSIKELRSLKRHFLMNKPIADSHEKLRSKIHCAITPLRIKRKMISNFKT